MLKKKSISKKAYEDFLNGVGVPEHDRYENGGRCRSKKYGTWLRRNDPIAFDVGYREFLRENS